MNYRRRSQSASTSSSFYHRSSLSPPQSAIGKRSYFSSNHSHVSSQNKWDIDAWQSKRRRRNVSPSGSGASSDDDFPSNNRSPVDRSALAAFTTSTPRPSFPSSSADFFPRNERDVSRLRHSTHIPSSFDLNNLNKPYSEVELMELRSNAFWDLQRSVAENGESLVRRMRDYENSRSRAETYSKVKDAQKRGRKRSSLIAANRKKQVYQDSEDDEDEEDEEDVQIISGEIPDVLISRGIRPTSTGDSSLAITRGRSLPGTQRQRSPSPCSSLMSDDDDFHMNTSPTCASFTFQAHSTSINTPVLSHSASSANSSMSSLPLLPSDAQSPPSYSNATDVNVLPSIPSPTASRSEKALAALSLAMANGAGSINDYAGLYFSAIAQPDEHWSH